MDEGQSGTPGTIWADRTVLTATAPPCGMPERTAVRDRLVDALDSPCSGAGSASAVLYGPAGTGKTALLRSVTDDVVPPDGTVCWLSCSPRETQYSLAAALGRQFGADIPESGLALDTVRERALDCVDDRSGPLVVVLDDVDTLPTDVRRSFVTDVVAALVADDVGVVATADDVTLRNDFDEREKAVLCGRELILAAYDDAQRRAILARRADAAFLDGAVDEAVLARVADFATREGRTLEDALELLALAGDRAVEDGRSRVTLDHVDAATEHLAVRRAERVLDSLPDHERLALRGLLSLGRGDDLPARAGSIYSAYVTSCQEADVAPNTERSLQNYLRSLTDTDLVTSEQVRTDRGGQYYRYDLRVDLDVLATALSADPDAETE